MSMKLIWDEAKRQSNLLKHGLDFCNAGCVLESRYCLNIELVRAGELRVQSLSYVFNRLSVLTVVHTARGDAIRIISFRYASQTETEAYYEWIGEKNDRT